MTTMTGLVFAPAPDLEGRARPDVLRRIAGRPVEAFAPLTVPNRYAVMVDGYVVAADGEELLVVPGPSMQASA